MLKEKKQKKNKQQQQFLPFARRTWVPIFWPSPTHNVLQHRIRQPLSVLFVNSVYQYLIIDTFMQLYSQLPMVRRKCTTEKTQFRQVQLQKMPFFQFSTKNARYLHIFFFFAISVTYKPLSRLSVMDRDDTENSH